MGTSIAACFLGVPCSVSIPGLCYSKKVHKGEHLYHTGDEFRSLFQVVHGSFKTLSPSSQGWEQVLGFYFPGEFMGLDAISDGLYPSTSIALEESEICALSYSAVTELCACNKDIQNNVHIAMSSEIRRKAGVTTLLAYASIEERVATFVIDVLNRTMKAAAEPLYLPLAMKRHEIANYLGMSGETLSRQFAKFARQGVIEGDAHGVHVLKRGALECLKSPVAHTCFSLPSGNGNGRFRKPATFAAARVALATSGLQ